MELGYSTIVFPHLCYLVLLCVCMFPMHVCPYIEVHLLFQQRPVAMTSDIRINVAGRGPQVSEGETLGASPACRAAGVCLFEMHKMINRSCVHKQS